MLSGPRPLLLSWFLTCVCLGCGGNSVTPTAPTPTSAPTSGPTPTASVTPAVPTSLNISSVSYRNRTARLDWSPSAGATSYRITLSRGATTLATFTSTVPSFDVTGLPVSESTSPAIPLLQVCVFAINGTAVSDTCRQRALVMPDFRDAVDALFFSRGPFADGAFPQLSAAIPPRTAWQAAGVPYGSTLLVRISSSVSAQHRADVRRAVEHINELFPGLYRLSVDEPGISFDADVRSGRFLRGEVMVAEFPQSEIASICRNASAAACAPLVANSREGLSNVALGSANSSRTVHHELGHALLGLGHLWAQPPPSPSENFAWWEWPVMGGASANRTFGVDPVRAFSNLEVEAFSAVVAAGIRPGAFRDLFVAGGLVR